MRYNTMRKKTIITIVSVAAALTLAIGATLAYLQDMTGWYSNTFEFADGLAVTLTDEATTYKIIPGKNQAKNTSVTLSNEDVPAYLYVVVKEENTSIGGKDIVNWEIADGWSRLAFTDPDIGWAAILPADDDISAENTGIYYRAVDANDEPSEFAVLKNNQVSYPLALSKSDIPDGTEIRLNFAARAIQQEGFDGPAEAWIGEETELPGATFTELDPAQVGSVTSDIDGWSGTLDTAVSFGSTETMDDIANKEYADWTCDFILSFNKEVAASQVHIFGQYDAFGPQWIGGPLGTDMVSEGTEIRIIEDWLTQAFPGVAVSYTDVVSLGTFNCGIAVDNPEAGLVATLQLVMTDDEGGEHVMSTQIIPIG